MKILAISVFLFLAVMQLPGQGVIAPNEKKEQASPPQKSANAILGVDPGLKPREPAMIRVSIVVPERWQPATSTQSGY